MDKYAVLKSLLNEPSKTYIQFDGANRIWKVWQAPTEAITGTPALLTEYIYTTPTSTVVQAEKEVLSSWDASYDASFTI